MAETRISGYEAKTILELKNHLQQLIDEGRLQGASFIISSDGRLIAKEALGLSGANGAPFSDEAIRPVQSIAKTIAAIAVLQLVDQGSLALDDKVARYVPEFDREGFRDIAIRHLLTHRSGLQADDLLQCPKSPSDDWITPLTGRKLIAEPGNVFDYSNAGFVLLGSIIARSSGCAYEQFVQERILAPLRMTMTSFRLSFDHERLISIVHPRETEWTDPPLHRNGAIPKACGGLFSTIDDLHKLGEMILDEGMFNGQRIVGAELVRQMTTEGLGLFLDGDAIGTMSSRTYSHHGYGWSMFTVDPEHRLVAVVFVPGIEDYVAESLHPTMRIIGSGIRN